MVIVIAAGTILGDRGTSDGTNGTANQGSCSITNKCACSGTDGTTD